MADEPVSVGGTGAGPTPYDYVLAAHGACTTMTLRMYADRKMWPLESVTVRLDHQRIHAIDCEECETKEGRIDRIERELELAGPLEKEQRWRLLQDLRKNHLNTGILELLNEVIVQQSALDPVDRLPALVG